jgi:hypothetical protein
MTTIDELNTIDAMRMDDTAREMSRNGVSLSHRDAEAFGADRIDWLRTRLGLIMTSDDRGYHFTPATVEHASAVCFVADAPGAYGAGDGRVWSAHRSIEDGRRAVREGDRVALHHGSLEPGTHWTSRMEQIYPVVE